MGSWRFPEVKFVHTNTSLKQALHVIEEANEVAEELNKLDKGLFNQARLDEEMADKYHSIETYFRRRHLEGADIHKIFAQVVEKNRLRGYYNEQPQPQQQPEAPKQSSDRYRERIIQRLDKQRAKGLKKYGQTLEFNTADILERIEHLQQELTDGLEYCEWIKEFIIDIRTGAEKAVEGTIPFRCYCCGKETTTAIELCGSKYFMCNDCLLTHVQANAKAVEEAKRQMEGRK